MDMRTDPDLTVVEAADELGLSPADVYGLVFGRELGFTQAANGRILVPKEAIEAYRAELARQSG